MSELCLFAAMSCTAGGSNKPKHSSVCPLRVRSWTALSLDPEGYLEYLAVSRLRLFILVSPPQKFFYTRHPQPNGWTTNPPIHVCRSPSPKDKQVRTPGYTNRHTEPLWHPPPQKKRFRVLSPPNSGDH